MTVLVDTNVLVYAVDDDKDRKQRVAESTLDALLAERAAAVSPQVLAEYAATLGRKWPHRLDRAAIAVEVDLLVASHDVLPLNATVSIAAVHASARYDWHIYDAQIWATAKVHGVSIVLTEDFEDGSEIEGVRFIDPFAPGFDVEALLAAAG